MLEMVLDWSVVISLVTGLLLIGGVGWKLASELGGIKASLQTFIATTAIEHRNLEGKVQILERKVEKIEDEMRTQG